MKSVLLLDANQRSSLAVARSLGQHGVRICVADNADRSLAGASRYASSTLRHPDAVTRPNEFVSWVAKTCETNKLDAVFPVTDVSTMLLAQPRDANASVKTICAPKDSYECVSDKADLVRLAEQVGVRTPRTSVATGLAEIESVLKQATFPVVLKPARSRVLVDGRIIATGVTVAHSASEALDHLRQQPWTGVLPCLVQEFIEGYGAGVFALYCNARPVAWFAHRRIREKPPQGGVSVLSESVSVDPALREAAERLLTAARWEAAAMVEFRIGTDGTPYLMEINGRLWGSLQLAIDSGIDFPWLMYRAACGEQIEPTEGFEVGKRLRWFMGDVDNLLLQVRGKGTAQNVSARLAALSSFIGTTFNPSARNEVFRARDPRPALFELKSWFSAG